MIRYIKSWFPVDILAIFPWDEMSSLDLSLFKLLRMLRLIRMVRLLKLFNVNLINTLVLRVL